MRSEEGKAILVVAHRFDRCRPALDVVTLLALGAHLSAVDVSVAISTFVTDVREDRLGMALGTADALVHTPKREPSLSMIELRHVPDRFPAGKRVAILAGNAQRPVRAACALVYARLVLGRSLGLLSGEGGCEKHQCRTCDEHGCGTICKRRSQVFRSFLLVRLQMRTADFTNKFG